MKRFGSGVRVSTIVMAALRLGTVGGAACHGRRRALAIAKRAG
jgi:hypothetical protein